MKALQHSIIVIMLILLCGTASYAQKMSPKTQRRARSVTFGVLNDLKRTMNTVYKEIDGTPRYSAESAEAMKQYFYNSQNNSARHIHRNLIDTKDTLLRDVPELMSISAFTDTLKNWYCRPDSCEQGVIFDFISPVIDSVDYYADPEIIAVNVFFEVDFSGELSAPHMAKYMKKVVKKETNDDDYSGGFMMVEDYGQETVSFDYKSAMATFLIRRDGDQFTDVKIFRIYIYDPYTEELPGAREIIRSVIASRNKMYLSANGGAGYSKARAAFDNSTVFESESNFLPGFDFDISFDYFFNDGPKKFSYGYSAGLGFSRYNASVSIDSFTQSFNDHSDELDKDYVKNLYASDIAQNLSLDYIDIPVSFKMKYKWRTNVNLYAEGGVVFSWLLSPTLTSDESGAIEYTGTFTYLFPQGNQQVVTFEDVPYYGFTVYDDLKYSNEDPGFSSLNISAMVNGGVMFWLSQRLSINTEVMYRYGFLNIMNTSLDEEFILSKGEGELNNIFKNCSNLHTNAFMLNLGISYFLKSNK